MTTNACQPTPQPLIFAVEIIDSRTALVTYRDREPAATAWSSKTIAPSSVEPELGIKHSQAGSRWTPYGPKDKPETHEEENP